MNNPRSLLIKTENTEPLKKVVTIRNNKNENKKIIIDIVNPPSPQKVVKNVPKKDMNKVIIKEEPIVSKDEDLQMPSDLFDCNYVDEKDKVTEVPCEYYFETDHEALRGNADYHKVLKTYSILQAKKIQVIRLVFIKFPTEIGNTQGILLYFPGCSRS